MTETLFATTLHEGDAQILPPAADQRAAVTAWQALLTTSADQRIHPEWRDLAARLTVRRAT